MSTLLINNRRYNCEPWELMNWDKLHAILRYDEQRRRSDRQSVDRLTAELLTKIAGVRRSLARRTDPDDRDTRRGVPRLVSSLRVATARKQAVRRDAKPRSKSESGR